MLVRMRLARIVIVEPDEQHMILLREVKGERAFPIIIGKYEALAIDRRVKGEKTLRPMTHDLALSIIELMGGTLEKVVISELQDHTFYAKLVVRRHGEVIEIDSRPSDAIAVAAGLEVPLFVDESVLREVC
ncbi:MAG: bifunctional nuclease family protein [Phycisphaerales bacterium]|nr:bifunctional nuclease family protein [Phycisphaerales bacterium]